MNHWGVFITKLFFVCLSVSSSLWAPYMTISQPGSYTLGSDVTYTPTGANDSIFVIAASNVSLDLGGYTIAESGLTLHVNGIFVNSGLSNLVIKNGVISNVTGTGILINSSCSRLLIDQITTFSCDTCGLAALGGGGKTQVSTFDIKNSAILSSLKGPQGDAALTFSFCSDFHVSNCRVCDNGSSLNNISGVKLQNVTHGKLTDVRSNGNIGNTIVNGFQLRSTVDTLLERCVAQGNEPQASASPTSCSGFEFLQSCTNNVLTGCLALSNTSLATTSTTIGFEINLGCDDNILQECQALQNGGVGEVSGFRCTSGKRNTMIDCIARTNICTTGTATGYLVLTSTATKLIRCIGSEQQSISTGIGIHVLNSVNSVIQECLCSENKGQMTSNSFGIRLLPISPFGNNLFTKNTALLNGSLEDRQLNGLASTQQEIQSIQSLNVENPWTNNGFIP